MNTFTYDNLQKQFIYLFLKGNVFAVNCHGYNLRKSIGIAVDFQIEQSFEYVLIIHALKRCDYLLWECAGESFLVPGATVATILMLGVLHGRRLYVDKKVHSIFIVLRLIGKARFSRQTDSSSNINGHIYFCPLAYIGSDGPEASPEYPYPA